MVLSLLQNVEAIPACRDRDPLPHALLCAAVTLPGDEPEVGIFARLAGGENVTKWSPGRPSATRRLRAGGKLLA